MSEVPSVNAYPNIFRNNITRSIRHVLSLIEQCGPTISTDERDQVLHTVEFALSIPETWEVVYPLLMVAFPKMDESGYWAEWIPYLEKGVAHCQSIDDHYCECELGLHLGLLYQQVGNFQAAQSFFESTLKGFQQLGAQYKEGITLNYLASLHRRYGNYDKVQILTEAASALIPIESPEHAQLYDIQAALMLDKREFEKALDYYTKAYEMFQTYTDTKRASWAMQGIANALSRLERYQESIDANKKAIQLQRQIQSNISIALTQMNMGTVYHLLGQPEKALSFYALAEPVLSRIRRIYTLALLCHNKGMSHRDLGCWEQAEQAFLKSITYWRHLNNPVSLVNSLDDLGIMYGQQGDHAKAVVAFQEALEQIEQIENLDERTFRRDQILKHLNDIDCANRQGRCW